MATLAVTGHINIAESSEPLIREALLALLEGYPASELTGVSCLAEGSDALFADAVLSVGGKLVAVLPSRDYRQRMVSPRYGDEFDRLCQAAAEVTTMPHQRATGAAYAAANRELLHRAELLVAIWDGRPGSGRGGTADAVAAARTAGLPVHVIWPAGAARQDRQREPGRKKRRSRPDF
ncbi:hypothetical protein [Kitasatospora sp. NPDC085879]|jgi:hypothetical protein|uniref:hypothetical protein n=1 Tax=Kitasatospora sp. NPDC085879 TaxID=3154769 RepID=UPI0034454BB7